MGLAMAHARKLLAEQINADATCYKKVGPPSDALVDTDGSSGRTADGGKGTAGGGKGARGRRGRGSRGRGRFRGQTARP